VITGIGIVAAQPLADVLAGKPPDPQASGMTPEITGFEVPEGAPTWGYEVLDLNLEVELPNVKSYIDRTSALALVAGKRALTDSGLIEREKRPAGLDIGCAFGTMMGCLDAMGIFWTKVKTSNPKFAQPLIFTHGYANSPSSLLCIEHGLRGPAATFSGERLAGAEALMFAYDQISSGAGEAMLVCASESLTQAVWNHFYSRGELKTETKDGIVLGEGALALVLESEDSAKTRGAPLLAELGDVHTIFAEPNAPLDGFYRMNISNAVAVQTHTHPGISMQFQNKLTGDVLSVEFLNCFAEMTRRVSERSNYIPQDVRKDVDGFTVTSRAVGNNRIQAHIKKS